MKRIGLSLVVLVGILSGLLYTADKKIVDAASPSKISRSCKICHDDLNTVLPKGHPAATGADIAACTPCHAPDYSGKAEPNGYAARLHRAHEGSKTKLNCLVCHNWISGKSFTVYKQKASLGKLMQKVFVSWTDSPNLDALHSKKKIDCMGCHGESLPREGDTLENSRCLLCHGPLDKLQARTTPKDIPDRNPHKSHLGDVNCTVCHHAHSASKVYCLECHKTFNMKIQGAAP
jgi:hypothetical protein